MILIDENRENLFIHNENSLEDLHRKRAELIDYYVGVDEVVFSEIYESPISYSFRMFKFKTTIHFVQFIKPN